MKKSVLALIALLALGTSGSPATADTMEITYGLTATATLGGVIPIGAFFGSATIIYSATGGVTSGPSGTVLHGPAGLAGATLTGPFGFTLVGDP